MIMPKIGEVVIIVEKLHQKNWAERKALVTGYDRTREGVLEIVYVAPRTMPTPVREWCVEHQHYKTKDAKIFWKFPGEETGLDTQRREKSLGHGIYE